MSTPCDLLDRLQDGAVSSAMPVSELLRRCQVFAARTDVAELGAWVRHELNGYPGDVELPDYRIFRGWATGDFVGPFQSGYKNVPLPVANLPRDRADWAQRAFIRQPIVSLEEMARAQKALGVPWPADLVVEVRDRFIDGYALVQATLHLNRADAIAAIDAVRNRILAFALDARQFVSSTQERDPQAAAALTQVFHNDIYGSVATLVQGSSQFSIASGFQSGDLAALLQAVRGQGVSEADAEQLRAAILADGEQKNRIGRHVAQWLGNMLSKAVTGTLGLASSTAGAVLPKLIEHYYNIRP